MTPEERALYIMAKFTHLVDGDKIKHCALIMVDGIIQNLNCLFDKGFKDVHMSLQTPKMIYRDIMNPEIKYWQQVKTEIENL